MLIHHTSKSRVVDNENDIEKIKEAFKEKVRGASASAFVDVARSVLYTVDRNEVINNRRAITTIVIKSNVVKTGLAERIQLPFEDESNSYNKNLNTTNTTGNITGRISNLNL